MNDGFTAPDREFSRNAGGGLGSLRLRTSPGAWFAGCGREEADTDTRRRLTNSNCRRFTDLVLAVDRKFAVNDKNRSAECIAPENCTDIFKRWTSRKLPPRWACGSFWSPKFFSLAACSSPTASIAMHIPPRSASAATCFRCRLVLLTHSS